SASFLEAVTCLTTLSPHHKPLAKRAAAASRYQVYIARSVWPPSRVASSGSSIRLTRMWPKPSRGEPPRSFCGVRAQSDPLPTKCSGRRERGSSQSAAGGEQGKTIPAFPVAALRDSRKAIPAGPTFLNHTFYKWSTHGVVSARVTQPSRE